MNKKIVLVASSIALLGLASCGTKEVVTDTQVNVPAANVAQEAAVEKEVVVAAPSAYDDFSAAPFSYRAYNGQDLTSLDKATVLFFGQASCGTCQKTDADLKAQESLPDNVSVIKVDFDTDTELNEKYGVTTKHTFVLIDENGNEIAKEIGLSKAQDIVNFVVENTGAEEAEPVAAAASAVKSVGAATAAAVTSKAADTASAASAAAEKAKAEAAAKAQQVAAAAEKAKAEAAAKAQQVAAAAEAQKAQVQAVAQTPVAASSATYGNYTGPTGKEAVLFFHASWCPSCVAADKNFKAENELAINADILKVDFDSNAALKQKYGVTTKHTFVRIDGNGNLISKMTTGNKSSDLQALFN